MRTSRKASSQAYTGKAAEINLVLSEPDVDLWRLRELALGEGGLVNDDLRRRAWPKLVGLHDRLFQDRRAQALALSQDNSSSRSIELSPKRVTRRSLGASTSSNSGSINPLLVRRDSLEKGLNKLSQQATSNDRLHSSTRSTTAFEDDEHSVASGMSVASSRDKILAISDDFEQIERDVARCTWHLLTGTQRSVAMQMEHKRHKKIRRLIRRKQRRLANLINLTLQESYSFLRGEQKLRYYQGYHDVACLILSTLGGSRPVSVKTTSALGSSSDNKNVALSMGLEMPSAVLLQLSQSHFADCMKANFLQLQTALRLTLFPLIAFFNPQVHAHLYECEMEPYFALSWVITWFSHDIRDTAMVKRLFDFFLVSHPLMPIYTSVAMILHPLNRQEVIKTECDFALMHQTLQGLPRNSSMVGWKYRPGDGYVSDDEEDDDDIDEEATVASHEILESDLVMFHAAAAAAADPSSPGDAGAPGAVESNDSSHMSALAASSEKVPFEELIDISIQYMDRLPPRELQNLATKYYGQDFVGAVLHKAPGISLLDTPPDWAVACSAKADWVLQQRARDEQKQQQQQQQRGGGTLTQRRGSEKKRNNSNVLSRLDSEDGKLQGDEAKTVEAMSSTDKKEVEIYVKEHAKSRAVIAAGFGSGDDPERSRRRRRRLLLASAVAVAVFAIVVGIQRDQTAQVQQPVGEEEIMPVVAVLVKESSSSSSSLGGPSSSSSASSSTTNSQQLHSVATSVADSEESDPGHEVQLLQDEISVKEEAGMGQLVRQEISRLEVEEEEETSLLTSLHSDDAHEETAPQHPSPGGTRELDEQPGGVSAPIETQEPDQLGEEAEAHDLPDAEHQPFSPPEAQESSRLGLEQELSSNPASEEEKDRQMHVPVRQETEVALHHQHRVHASAHKDWRVFANAMRWGLKARRDQVAQHMANRRRRRHDPNVLLLSDKPAWANVAHAVQLAVGRQVATVGGFLNKRVKPRLVRSSDASLRILVEISSRLIRRDIDSLVHLQKAFAVVLKDKVSRESAALRAKLGNLKHNVKPQLRKFSMETREKLGDVRNNLSAGLGKRTKRVLGDIQKRTRKDKRPDITTRLKGGKEAQVQPRLQSVSSQSQQSYLGHSGLIQELQDVAHYLQISAAIEEAVYVLLKIGDFPIQRAMLEVARFEFSHRATGKLKSLASTD